MGTGEGYKWFWVSGGGEVFFDMWWDIERYSMFIRFEVIVG